MATILWSELGAPTEPGDVEVKGLGIVVVMQGNINYAKSVGGDPEFELLEATAITPKMRRYLLGVRFLS